MLATWQAADDIELYGGGWTFDHFYPIFSDSTGPCLEGWITLTALAQATSRLRVGVLVTGNVYRHPAVLAKMAATLDVVSDGRLELGIGAGWNEEECTAYGIDLPPLRERFDRFDEALEVIVGLLTNETTTFAGQHYQLTEARSEPKAVQRPHPPIVIGGTGPTRTLKAAARWAQHWNHPGGTVEQWLESKATLARHCEEVGRDVAEITTSTHLRIDPDAPGEGIDNAKSFADAGLDLGIAYLPTPHTPARVHQLADLLATV